MARPTCGPNAPQNCVPDHQAVALCVAKALAALCKRRFFGPCPSWAVSRTKLPAHWPHAATRIYIRWDQFRAWRAMPTSQTIFGLGVARARCDQGPHRAIHKPGSTPHRRPTNGLTSRLAMLVDPHVWGHTRHRSGVWEWPNIL